MDPSTLNLLLNNGVLGVIAVVFFKDYFDKQKRDTISEAARLEHEKALAIILNQSTGAVLENQEVIKSTKRMHEDMDMTIERIESKIDELTEKIELNEDQNSEIISTLVWIKETLRGLGEEDEEV